ncbi:phage tail protein [Streptomyces sp. RGM 3693]|uniref:phage tail protein n=1 Tax=Streptomyces sp. RGM 3693 TaxID=3413284 RepID=UPI003D28DB18
MFSLQINGQDAENISTMDALYAHHITLTRGSEHSELFDDWINSAINNGPNAGRNFAVTTYDGNNQQIHRWEFTDAWIYKVVGESISIIFSKMEVV